MRCFAMDLTTTVTAEMLCISLCFVNMIYLKIRQRLAEACEHASPLNGSVEVDEFYFGVHRVRGRRGRRAALGKTIVIGQLKRQGMVYTEIVPDFTKATLQGIVRGHIDPASDIHSDGRSGYDGPVDIGCDKHYRINHGAS